MINCHPQLSRQGDDALANTVWNTVPDAIAPDGLGRRPDVHGPLEVNLKDRRRRVRRSLVR
jgi:hypothetical protein